MAAVNGDSEGSSQTSCLMFFKVGKTVQLEAFKADYSGVTVPVKSW